MELTEKQKNVSIVITILATKNHSLLNKMPLALLTFT